MVSISGHSRIRVTWELLKIGYVSLDALDGLETIVIKRTFIKLQDVFYKIAMLILDLTWLEKRCQVIKKVEDFTCSSYYERFLHHSRDNTREYKYEFIASI